jgi:hypothetical protein
MFTELVSTDDATFILDSKGTTLLEEAVIKQEIKPVGKKSKKPRFLVGDLVMLSLAQVIGKVGVEGEKAIRYSEAVLGSRLRDHDETVVDWIENEAQDLFCLIEDDQLSRIYLRNKEDFKEVDVGAVKPVLFPTTRCEINVFRVIRPVVYRARQCLHAA